MRGKEKCRALKEIRRQIAEENDIPYAVSQCTYQGECKGTCPKCESELRYLERELAVRRSLGRAVAIVGISTSVCAGLTACRTVDRTVEEPFWEETAGETISVGDLEGEATEADDGQDLAEDIGLMPQEGEENDASAEDMTP